MFLQISLLIEEIARLRTAIQALQESHNVQIQRLEESLDAKRQHIIRLENRIGKSDYDDMKKENRWAKAKQSFDALEINTFCVYVYNKIEAHLWLSGKYLVRFENGYKVISFGGSSPSWLETLLGDLRKKSKFIFYYAAIKSSRILMDIWICYFYCTPRPSRQRVQNAFVSLLCCFPKCLCLPNSLSSFAVF